MNVQIATLLDLVHHLVLVHHFTPFTGISTKRGVLKPLNTILPMSMHELNEYIGSKREKPFVPVGIRGLDHHGNVKGEKQVSEIGLESTWPADFRRENAGVGNMKRLVVQPQQMTTWQ